MASKAKPVKVVEPGIKLLSDGRYYAFTTWRDPKTGKRVKREAVTDSLSEAREKRLTLKEAPRTVRRSRESCSSLFKRWASEHFPRIDPSTRDRYAHELGRLFELVGDIYVDALEPPDIRKAQAALATKLSPRTVNATMRTLKLALDLAVEEGTLAANPSRAVRALPEARNKLRSATALSPSELGAFLKALRTTASEDVGRAIELMMWTGMRSGEVRALSWDVVDFKRAEITLRRAARRDGSIRESTKSGDARHVSITEPIKALLQAQRAWLKATSHPVGTKGLIFPASPKHAEWGARRRGGEVQWVKSRSVLNENVIAACSAAGLPEASSHGLRRSFERGLRLAGVDSATRRALAGWADPHTQSIYDATDRSDRLRAQEAMTALVLGSVTVGGNGLNRDPEGPDSK